MTNLISRTLAIAVLGAAAAAVAPAAEPAAASPTFKKIKLTDKFYSEGATFADFNKDGQLDYAAGPFWYEGPAFEKKHTIYEGSPIDPLGYSANFLAFAHDFNGDGWADIFVVGFPGAESPWFENPQGKDGPWKRHVAFSVTDNESPGFGDLTGDGKPELIFHAHGLLGWAEPDPANPTAEWKFHKISHTRDDRFQRFTHGLGYGDVNGDQRLDLLEAKGWWEQPASLTGDPEWKFHPVNFANGGAQMYAYDVDGDGDNDVITSTNAHGYGLAWHEQKKEGDQITFARHDILSEQEGQEINGVQFSQLHAIDLYDIDGDGLKDIVTGKRFWAHGDKGDAQPNAPAVLYWFQLKRDGGKATFVPHRIDDDSGVGTQVTAGDLNGDKLGDVVVGNKKGQFIFIQQPAK
jgi:hypothetical protein